MGVTLTLPTLTGRGGGVAVGCGAGVLVGGAGDGAGWLPSPPQASTANGAAPITKAALR
jgi:hypothetical protein